MSMRLSSAGTLNCFGTRRMSTFDARPLNS